MRRILVLCAVCLTSVPGRAQEASPTDTTVSRKDQGEQLAAERPASTTKLVDTATKHVSMEIGTYADNNNVTVLTPSIAGRIENILEGASLSGSYLVDVVSAASPDIVATASPLWTEVRNAGSLEARYKPKTFGVMVGSSISIEPDYISFGIGSEMTLDLNEKNTTLQAGFGYGHDTIGRCGAQNTNSPTATSYKCTPYSVFARNINRSSFDVGITQILGKATVASLVADLTIENGDQSKPYRYIPLFSASVAPTVPNGASVAFVTANRVPERPLEQLPLNRQRLALTGRLAHRFESSTLKLEERLYGDTWALFASTTDARWIFDLGRRVAFWPHARFHAQAAVSFWQKAYVSGPAPNWSIPEFRTGNRELGPLWTATGGGGIYFYLGKDAEPTSSRLTLQIDGMYTSFLDDLYVTARSGVVSSLTFEVDL